MTSVIIMSVGCVGRAELSVDFEAFLLALTMQIDDDEDWFPEDPIEAFKVMREERMFDVSDMYTTADAWGWTWEREIKNKMPRKWSQEWEVELAIKIMHKVFFTLLTTADPIG